MIDQGVVVAVVAVSLDFMEFRISMISLRVLTLCSSKIGFQMIFF